MDRNGVTAVCVRSALLVLASFSFGCAGDDDAAKDAGAALQDDAGAPTPDASTGRRFAVATATLLPVDPNDVTSVQGMALFRATDVGVDLELTMPACTSPSPDPLEILEADDCSPLSLQAPVWSEGHGTGIPAVSCVGATSGFGLLRYQRRGGRPGSWTVGGPPGSDVIGRALVLRDGQSGQPRLCGVIERGEDVVWTQLPAPGEPPSATARAALSGLCYAKQFTANAAEGCPDEQALARCSSTHCDVGGCLQACSEYASCLDAAEEPCASSFLCPQSEACAQCQSALLSCTLGYCGEDFTCVPPITPDGPCGEVLACCALQGEDADRCLSVFQTLLTISGDASCIGAINDRETVGHLRSPCRFEYEAGMSPPDAGQQLASEPLADDIAGTPCSGDADCPGGVCARGPQLPDVAASEGYCTRACTTTSQCGIGGTCVSSGDGEGLCLGNCGTEGECRAGFQCAGAVMLPVFGSPGACLPMRPADMLADGVAGRSCSDDAECPGGQCATRNLLGTEYPDNYCTARCYEDSHCGAGGVCLLPLGSFDPGYCLLACETHDDCPRDGYRCWAMNDGTRLFHACYPGADPLPDHSVGLPCDDASACGADHAQCATEMPYGSFSIPEIALAPGGYCTQPCALDEECGAGAQCINVNIRGGLCMASCSDAAPCREGYVCLAHLRDGPDDKVCVPAPPTAAP